MKKKPTGVNRQAMARRARGKPRSQRIKEFQRARARELNYLAMHEPKDKR